MIELSGAFREIEYSPNQIDRGPNQIKTPEQILPGTVYTEHNAAEKDREPYKDGWYSIALTKPYPDLGGLWVRVLNVWGLKHEPIEGKHSLADHAVTPYSTGVWNDLNWIEVPDISPCIHHSIKLRAVSAIMDYRRANTTPGGIEISGIVDAALFRNIHGIGSLFDRAALDVLAERLFGQLSTPGVK